MTTYWLKTIHSGYKSDKNPKYNWPFDKKKDTQDEENKKNAKKNVKKNS